MIETIRNKLLWQCFDVPAIMRFNGQLKQWGVLSVLPELMAEYAAIFGETTKRNGNGVEWAKTESELQPHLTKWSQCSKKNFRIVAA